MSTYNHGMDGDGINHGTLTGYANHGCRCAKCKQAGQRYHADRREKLKREKLAGVTELRPRPKRVPAQGSSTLSGSNMGKGKGVQGTTKPVTFVDTPDEPNDPAPQRNRPREPGECELAVIAETDNINAAEQRPGMVSAAIRMARILDNDALVALHPTTSRQLTGILETLRGQSRGKRKGRLASVQQMTARRASAASG